MGRLVKGPNGTVMELDDVVASGLVGGSEKGWDYVEDEGAAPVDGVPAKSANKGAWVAYAVAQGADEAEAKKLKKDELVAQYGDEEPASDPADTGDEDDSSDDSEK